MHAYNQQDFSGWENLGTKNEFISGRGELGKPPVAISLTYYHADINPLCILFLLVVLSPV